MRLRRIVILCSQHNASVRLQYDETAMISPTLAKEARGVWLEYGLEVARAFRFAPLPVIVKAPLDSVLQTSDDAAVKAFIGYVRRQTATLKEGGEASAEDK